MSTWNAAHVLYLIKDIYLKTLKIQKVTSELLQAADPRVKDLIVVIKFCFPKSQGIAGDLLVSQRDQPTIFLPNDIKRPGKDTVAHLAVSCSQQPISIPAEQDRYTIF